MKKLKTLLSVLLVLALVLSLCACSSKTGAQKEDAAKESPGKRFAFIILARGSSWGELPIMGMEDTLRKGDTLDVFNYEFDDNKFMEMTEQAINMQYDGIIIFAKDPDLNTEAAEMCKKAGIPCVAIDLPVTDDSALSGYFPGSDYYLGYYSAQALAQGMKAKNGSEACKILATSKDTDQVGQQRLAGFTDGIAEHDGMEIVYNIMEEWTTADMLGPIENVLASHPEIDAIWATNGDVGAAAVQVVSEQGKTDDIVIVSIECSLWVKEQIDAGLIYAGIDSNPYDEGTVGMTMMYNAIDGVEFERVQTNMGKIITAENINDSTTWVHEMELSKAE